MPLRLETFYANHSVRACLHRVAHDQHQQQPHNANLQTQDPLPPLPMQDLYFSKTYSLGCFRLEGLVTSPRLHDLLARLPQGKR